jgi:hypothetical protein
MVIGNSPWSSLDSWVAQCPSQGRNDDAVEQGEGELAGDRFLLQRTADTHHRDDPGQGLDVGWRELAAVHGALHQDPVRLDPGPDPRPGRGLRETFVRLGQHQQPGQSLQLDLLVIGGVRDEQRDGVRTETAGVRQVVQADVGLAQPRRGGEHQARLCRPAPAHCRPRCPGSRGHHVDRHALVPDIYKYRDSRAR